MHLLDLHFGSFNFIAVYGIENSFECVSFFLHSFDSSETSINFAASTILFRLFSNWDSLVYEFIGIKLCRKYSFHVVTRRIAY